MKSDFSPAWGDIRAVAAPEEAVAAPFCSRQLADMGADVVKVERPDGGDFARAYDGALRGLSAYFAWLNRGKRSIALDLKTAGDREVFAKFAGACGCVYSQSRAGRRGKSRIWLPIRREEQSAAHLVRHLGIRTGWSLSR